MLSKTKAEVVEKRIAANVIDYGKTIHNAGEREVHEVLREAIAASSSRMIFVPLPDHLVGCRESTQESNGFAGSKVVTNGADSNENIEWLRCLVKNVIVQDARPVGYEWFEMTFFLFRNSNGKILLLGSGVPKEYHLMFEESLKEVITSNPAASTLQHLELALFQGITQLYDEAIWTMSKVIRALEKSRPNDVQQQENPYDFTMMHELLRHAIHTTEVLQVAVDSTNHFCNRKVQARSSDQSPARLGEDAYLEELDHWQKLLKNLMHRSQSNESRLKNEINLALNLVAQRDSRATIELSYAARRDSAAMRIIAVVTLIFLPATFVSTIFSMSFFTYSSDSRQWLVAPQLWIYWAVACPLTVITMASWAGSQLFISKREALRQNIPLLTYREAAAPG